MKNLQMPHSYISVSEEELRSISGGGPLGDALDLFFSNLRLDDLFFSGGLISLSFTFVPMLLFNVVKTGFNFVVSAYDTIADLFHFSHEERDMVQYISDQQRREEEKEQLSDGTRTILLTVAISCAAAILFPVKQEEGNQ